MKERTKKILKGMFFFLSWIVDTVRYIKKKKGNESNKVDSVNNK